VLPPILIEFSLLKTLIKMRLPQLKLILTENLPKKNQCKKKLRNQQQKKARKEKKLKKNLMKMAIQFQKISQSQLK
jgi:hypothetical protein